jgi:hypothetical protein
MGVNLFLQALHLLLVAGGASSNCGAGRAVAFTEWPRAIN